VSAQPGPTSGPSTGGGMRDAMRPGRHVPVVARAKDPRGTLRRLVTYFGEFRARLYVVLACIVLYTLLGLAGPYLMGLALDRFIARGDADGLARIVLWMIIAFLATSLFQTVSSWLMAAISQRALKRLRRDLFFHLQTLPMDFFERNPSGELMSRLTNDISAIGDAVAQNVTSLFASALSMVGIVVAMFVLDHRLAIAAVVVVPIMVWFTRFVAVFTRKGFKELQKHLGQLNGVMEEAIGGQKIVTVFGRNESVMKAFRVENERVYRAGIYANTYALLLMPLTGVLGNLFVIVLAGLGGWLALDGLVTVGVIATFINYGQNFVNPLRQISNLYNTLQAALAGAERVFEILDTDSEVDDANAARSVDEVRGHVELDHVTFGYRPDRTVLDDVSLEAKPGQIVALVGPTGAGKTTIINLLTRFYEVDRGAIRIDGVDLRDLRKDDLRRKLGLVLQDTFLFGTTVMENIRYGRLSASDDEVIAAAKLADADHFIRQLPHGYQTVLSERAGNLSQGQRQLLAIARTLLAEPSILVLDEATSSVDTRTEARIQQSLLRLMKGRTSFVIAHRLSTIRDADQVLVIDAGRIVERGTHDELLARRGFYHRLYTSQFKGHAL
jgi:ATP-binding cassette, subfamily B, multidrug efflux pump